ncbi:hypothetical protein GCM10011591_00960 [Nocardia camponoti]|uniref:Uncharacterized protein n=1 Tax=Nocardia camponoti TaxID=1616106 RepID=A0A917Q8X6_9NOCA|nr:hypothetical protein GCM10011591_00960 [Nocardia camponoti]
MLLLIIGAPLLVLAMGVAVFAMRNERQQRMRAELAVRERATYEQVVTALAQTTLPNITEAVRQHEVPSVLIDLPGELAQTAFGQSVRWIASTYAEDLRAIADDTRATVERYAEQRRQADVAAAVESVRAELAASTQQARAEVAATAEQARIDAATAAEGARAELSAASRAATSAAVRSFGTSLVSLGTDLGQTLSSALREHRDDAVYETLSRLDHTVQQMIRQAQSYVIVSGGLPGRRWPQQSLTDVVGGATGRVRDFVRVRSAQCDRVVISRARSNRSCTPSLPCSTTRCATRRRRRSWKLVSKKAITASR